MADYEKNNKLDESGENADASETETTKAESAPVDDDALDKIISEVKATADMYDNYEDDEADEEDAEAPEAENSVPEETVSESDEADTPSDGESEDPEESTEGEAPEAEPEDAEHSEKDTEDNGAEAEEAPVEIPAFTFNKIEEDDESLSEEEQSEDESPEESGKEEPDSGDNESFKFSRAASVTDSEEKTEKVKKEKNKKPREKETKKSFVTTLILVILFIILIGAIAFAVVKFTTPQQQPKKNKTTTSMTTEPTTTLPAGYEIREMSENDVGKGELVLINYAHKCKFISDSKLISLYDIRSNFMLSNSTHRLNENTAYAVRDWLDGFYAETNSLTINVISTYRSHADQQELFDYYTEKYGSEEEARKWSALPGYSEHHTGLAVDIQVYNPRNGVSSTYTGEGIYSWLNENAYKYGIILRYPEGKSAITGISYETWHFRYIGVPHATAMKQLDMDCYEIYLNYLRSHTFDSEHFSVTTDEGDLYEIYFVQGLEVPVPTDRSYTISGNNIDGFIVTIKN